MLLSNSTLFTFISYYIIGYFSIYISIHIVNYNFNYLDSERVNYFHFEAT